MHKPIILGTYPNGPSIKASFPGVKGGLIFMPGDAEFEIWEETP